MSKIFEFTPENLVTAQQIVAKYPKGREASAVLPLLDLGQRQNNGWASDAVMNGVALFLDMPRIRVIEVASFYTMISMKPVGKYLLQFCTTTPCWLRNSEAVLVAASEYLGVGLGQTTEDGMFSMLEVECLGACVNAPIVQINDDMYEDLTAESMVAVLKALKTGETPPHGTQIDRQKSAPSSGAAVLTNLTFSED
jgi:NADH-quinone oxidoreductase E subunit